MEIFLNIAWLVVSISLALLWKRCPHDIDGRSLHSDKRTQLIALALLIVILFPVVSMTDDVHAMSTAEIEHITRRANHLPIADQPADLNGLLHAQLFLTQYLNSLHTFALFEPSIQDAKPLIGAVRQTANRPPPFAV